MLPTSNAEKSEYINGFHTVVFLIMLEFLSDAVSNSRLSLINNIVIVLLSHELAHY